MFNGLGVLNTNYPTVSYLPRTFPACFSPGVSQEVRSTWSKYSEMYKKVQLKVDEELQGGQIAISFEELDSVEWFFATVEDTDWVGSLRQLPIVVSRSY